MQITMENKRVLITAGGSGICKTVAEMFIKNKAKVHICDVDKGALDQFHVLYPEAGLSLCDVSDPEQVSQLFADADRSLGGLDILINGAGIGGPAGSVEQIDISDWGKTIAVNLNGTFYCTKLAIPRIRKAGGGSIINFSSTAGFLAYANRSPYAAAKWGIIGFTKTLALEVGKDSICVNAICPGPVEGERMTRVIEKEAEVKKVSVQAIRKNYTKGNALNTFINPEEIASTILFLCSSQGCKITGQAISVDGFVETHE